MKLPLNIVIQFVTAFLCCMIAVPLMAKSTGNTVSFTENKGQLAYIDGKQVNGMLFYTSLRGMKLYIGNGTITYQLSHADYEKENINNFSRKDLRKEKDIKTEFFRVDMTLIGANPTARIKKGKVLPGYQNFYLGHCPKGIRNVRSYDKVVFENIYSNIDWVIYSNESDIKYDFIVHPGGDPTQIKFKYTYAQNVQMDENGDLVIKTTLGEIIEKKPYSYQQRNEIRSRFCFNNDTYGFEIGAWNKNEDLIIDPTLDWCTLFGGSNGEDGRTCAGDNLGGSYLGGRSESTTSVSYGGYQLVHGGGSTDAFVVKFGPSGNREWATYLGGTVFEETMDLAVDSAHFIYAIGYTQSPEFPVTSGAHDTTYTFISYVGFITKFDTAGTLKWSTFIGGNAGEIAFGCCVDAHGDLLVCGETISISGIATPGTHQTSITPPGNYEDAFLVKFDSSGTRLWGTYYGGPDREGPRSCCSDTAGNIFMAGFTASLSGIASPGAHLTSFAGGWGTSPEDCFLVKFNPNGIRIWGTYYGGPGDDSFERAGADVTGSVYVSGRSNSQTGITTPGAYQIQNSGSTEPFVVRFNSAGVRQWGTFYGDSLLDCYAGTIDREGNYLIAGWTSNNNVPSYFYNGFQNFLNGLGDGFIVKFDTSGMRVWGTYFGGSGPEDVYDISTDMLGHVYVAGSSFTNPGLATPGAYQTTYTGTGGDAFLLRVDDSVAPDGIFESASANPFQLLVFPNPTNGEFTIQFNNNADTKGNISIIDISGRKIMSKNINGKNVSFTTRISVAGMYLVVVNTGNQVYFQKIVVN